MREHSSRDSLTEIPHQRQFVIPASQGHHNPYSPGNCRSYIQDEGAKDSDHNNEIQGGYLLLRGWLRKEIRVDRHEMQRRPGNSRDNPYESDIAESYSSKEKERLQTMKANEAILPSKEQHEQ